MSIKLDEHGNPPPVSYVHYLYWRGKELQERVLHFDIKQGDQLAFDTIKVTVPLKDFKLGAEYRIELSVNNKVIGLYQIFNEVNFTPQEIKAGKGKAFELVYIIPDGYEIIPGPCKLTVKLLSFTLCPFYGLMIFHEGLLKHAKINA